MQDLSNPGAMPLLLKLVEENAGIPLQESDGATSFFELGLDSLFLTQFSVSLGKRFGVNLTFRQLSTELGNLDKLAIFLDRAVASRGLPHSSAAHSPPGVEPPGEMAAPPLQGAAVVRRGGLAVMADPLIQLFLSQVEVMQQQLNALSEAIFPTASNQPGMPPVSAEQNLNG